MSFIPDKEKYGNSFQIPHAPPIRKLFSSVNTEDGEGNVDESDTFRVFLRIKPNAELKNSNDCIRIEDSVKLVCKPPQSSKFKKLERVEYTFSHIFGPKTTQIEIFSKCVVSCVEDLLFARDSLIFAYGTTNAGKTFTVQGTAKSPGIIPQVLHTLFCNIKVDQKVQYKPCLARDILKMKSSTSQEEVYIKNEILRSFHSSAKFSKSSTLSNDSSHFMQALQKSFVDLKGNKPVCSVWISFLEVYNETIYDLLDSTTTSRKPLKLAADQNDNFYVKELKQIYVSNAEEAFTIYQYGKRNLNIASTKMNENSSRSHCILTIHVINLDTDDQPILSKLCICDLAGTERLTKTQNTGIRLKESGNINGSLFQLNRCLRAIRENQTRRTNQLIPYRHSNLTKLLHSALDDRTDEKIIMIVNINPSAELYDETQQVLKMCAIASKIKSKPIAKKFQQSSRFTTLIYGRETASVDGERNHELLDCEEDSSKHTDDLEIQGLNEKILRQEEEINRLKERFQIRENYHENTKNNLKEYCEKVETTYKNRVKSLEERLKSQKEYYIWKIEDVKKNTLLESICDEAIREELFKKDAQIEELEKKLVDLQCEDDRKNLSLSFSDAVKNELSRKGAQIEELEKKVLELQRDDHCRNLSSSEEIHEKDAKIKELELLIQEAKEEYLSLERKYLSEMAKVSELENELCDKNEMIEQFENHLNAKQNAYDELEQKIESVEESLYQNTIEHEKILAELEKDRDSKLAAHKNEIEELNKKLSKFEKGRDDRLAAQERKIEELKEKLKERDNKLAVDEKEIDELNGKLNELEKDTVRRLIVQSNEIRELKVELAKLEEDRDSRLTAKEMDIEELKKKLNELEKDRDCKLDAQESEIEKLKYNILSLKQTIQEVTEEAMTVHLEKLHITEKGDGNTNTKRYNTRRNNKTPSGKENRILSKGTPIDVPGNKSSKMVRGKAKTPLAISTPEDALEANVFRNIPEKAPSPDLGIQVLAKQKKKLFSSSPSPDHHTRDYEFSRDASRFVEMTTPVQTVKLMKKKK